MIIVYFSLLSTQIRFSDAMLIISADVSTSLPGYEANVQRTEAAGLLLAPLQKPVIEITVCGKETCWKHVGEAGGRLLNMNRML